MCVRQFHNEEYNYDDDDDEHESHSLTELSQSRQVQQQPAVQRARSTQSAAHALRCSLSTAGNIITRDTGVKAAVSRVRHCVVIDLRM